MSKRNKRRKDKSPSANPAESSTSQAVTVLWMTSLLATVVGEIVALAMRLVVWFESSPTLLLFSNVMLLISAAMGVVCLAMTPVVLRWRDTPPPRQVTQFAVVVSLLPIVTLIAVLIWGQ